MATAGSGSSTRSLAAAAVISSIVWAPERSSIREPAEDRDSREQGGDAELRRRGRDRAAEVVEKRVGRAAHDVPVLGERDRPEAVDDRHTPEPLPE